MGWWMFSNKDIKMSALFNLSHCFSFFGNHKIIFVTVWNTYLYENKCFFQKSLHLFWICIIYFVFVNHHNHCNHRCNYHQHHCKQFFYHCMMNVVIILATATIINITVIIANSSYLRKITVVRARSEARTVENIFSWILLLRFTIEMRRRRFLLFFVCFEFWDCLAFKLRHEICQKIYTAGFSGLKIYALNFTEFKQFWW